MQYELVEGWTASIDIRLLAMGATPSGTMGGMSAALVLKDELGNTIDTTGDVSIVDAAGWVVRYSPDPADLQPGTYQMRVKVTDSGGKVSYFPSGEPDFLRVRKETY